MAFVEPEIEPVVPAASGPSANEIALQRENAILRALPGVDLSTPLGMMFSTSYAGDLDPATVHAQAVAVGLIAEAGEEIAVPAPVVAAAPEIELQQVRDGLGASVSGVLAPASAEEIAAAQMPSEQGFVEMQAAIRRGQPREDAAANWINRQVTAAATGDERAQFNGWTADQLARR